MANTLKVLAYAIRMEEEGEKFYRENIDKVSNQDTKEVLIQLADMESEHVELLKKEFESISKGEKIKGLVPGKVAKKIFTERKKSEKVTEAEGESALGDLAILRMAYLIEDDLAQFYKKAAENASDKNIKETYKILANWEIEHRNMLHKIYDERFHDSWFDMGFSPF